MEREMVVVWWDSDREKDRWHVELLRKKADGSYEVFTGSDDPEFPVRVNDFGPFQEDLLIRNIKEVFPDADIRLKL